MITTAAAGSAAADSALRELTEAKARLLALASDGAGWYPAELDLAIAELTRSAELAAAARETIADYVMRL
ncbi:hypothetical protein ACTG9Q_26090 [Actinokineospora sp. 24-640]